LIEKVRGGDTGGENRQ